MARTTKPKLVKMGPHFLNPDDVCGIKEAKRGLYIIKLRSEPEPEYPLWLSEKELESCLQYFNVEGDSE